MGSERCSATLMQCWRLPWSWRKCGWAPGSEGGLHTRALISWASSRTSEKFRIQCLLLSPWDKWVLWSAYPKKRDVVLKHGALSQTPDLERMREFIHNSKSALFWCLTFFSSACCSHVPNFRSTYGIFLCLTFSFRSSLPYKIYKALSHLQVARVISINYYPPLATE